MAMPIEVLRPVAVQVGEAPGDGRSVTVLVKRSVSAEDAESYAAAVADLNQILVRFPGFVGSSVFRRSDGGLVEFTIVQRFASEEAHVRWMDSSELAAWIARITPLARTQVELTRYHGLEGLFAPAGDRQAPARWKMAVLVWLAIFPTATIMNALLGPQLAAMPLVPRMMLTSAVTVTLLSYVLMPLLTRACGSWLARR